MTHHGPQSAFLSHYWLIVDYSSKVMDAVNIPLLLHDSSCLSPLDRDVKVVWTFHDSTPIGHICSTHKKFISSIRFDEVLTRIKTPPPPICPCNTAFPSNVDPRADGHVCCMSPYDVYPSDSLTRTLLEGFKTKIPHDTSTKAAFLSIQTALNCFTLLHTDHRDHLFSARLENWANTILGLAERILYNVHVGCSSVIAYPQVPWKTISDFGTSFSVLPIDKACQNIAIVCNTWMANEIVSHTSNLDSYARFTGPLDSLCGTLHSQIKELLHPMHILPTSNLLPQFYGVPKLHKPAPKPYVLRPIVATVDSFLENPNRVLQSVLQLVEDSLRKAALVPHAGRPRSYWRVTSGMDALLRLDQVKDKIIHVATVDVKAMYTSLTQSFLGPAVLHEISYALHLEHASHFVVTLHNTAFGNHKDHASFGFGPRHQDSNTYDIFQLEAIINFVIREYLFTVGNAVIHQINGIPMGGGASPAIAIIALGHLERIYANNHPSSPLCNHIFRLMDDMLVINYPGFHKNYDIIYRKAETGIELELVQSVTNGATFSHTHFLDLSLVISRPNFRLSISVYNKTNEFPFEVIRLPSPHSNLPKSTLIQILASEIFRHWRLTRPKSDSLDTIRKLLIYLVTRRKYSKILIYRALNTLNKGRKILGGSILDS